MGLHKPDHPNFDGMRVMAISDMNNDKYNDLITLSTDSMTVSVYYFNKETLQYDVHTSFFVGSGMTAEGVIVMKEPRELQSLIVVAYDKTGTYLRLFEQFKTSYGGGYVFSFASYVDSTLNGQQIYTRS